MNQDCTNFRSLLEQAELSLAESAAAARHKAACPECARVEARLTGIELIASKSLRSMPRPLPASRERLEASWRNLALRKSLWSRLSFWNRVVLEPKILRPLNPHVAMIVGFVFFTYSIMAVQVMTGMLTIDAGAFSTELRAVASAAADLALALV